VKRALQRELQTRLAQGLLKGDFGEGDTVRVEASGSVEEGLTLVREGGPRPGSAGGKQQQQQQQQQQQEQPAAVAAGDKPPKAAAPKQRRVVVSRKASIKDKDRDAEMPQAVE
jgi:hypothetical protein